MRRTSPGRAIIAWTTLGLTLAAAADESRANGRAPATVAVRFQPGAAGTMIVPVTFGLLVSQDGGESFRWVCEGAVGYAGIFDPDYAVTAEGDIYATTFDGLQVSRDGGCSFETIGGALSGDKFAYDIEVGPDGRVWAVTSNGEGSNDVYVSADGSTFESSNLFDEKAWWLSLRTSAADPQRIYVSGFLPKEGPADGGIPAEALLRRSLDGGATWEELPVEGFVFGDEPRLYILDSSPTDADVLFARAVAAFGPAGDVLYRSGDGGLTWEKKIDFGDTLSAFVIRADGQTVIAGTANGCPDDDEPDTKGCVRISHDAGVTWAATREEPRLACIGERGDGTLFGCGANWEPDNFALGRSQDGETWEKVYRFVETAGPLECPAATEQAECAALTWPGLCVTFGICPPPPPAPDAGQPEPEPVEKGGCSRADGSSTDAAWVLGLLVLLFAFGWRRARRSR